LDFNGWSSGAGCNSLLRIRSREAALPVRSTVVVLFGR
jgi:hypothetical protein